MDQEEIAKKIHGMGLCEAVGSKELTGQAGYVILRMPGGWVVNYNGSSCFVPHDNEFQLRADGFKRKSPVKKKVAKTAKK